MPTPYAESVYARLARAEDEVKQIRLAHMRWIANGLLAAVTLLYAMSVVFRASSPWWAYIGAFAEAAMVGALADWFAVTALFRHPLGLSFVPHTAIVPKNKDRIADNLGQFVQGEFFSTERITAVIKEAKPAARLARWMADERHAEMIGAMFVKLLGYGLTMLDDATVRAFLHKALAGRFGELDLSTLGGRILHGLTQDGRHQAVLDQMLAAASEYANDASVKRGIARFFAEKLPLYFRSLKDKTATFAIEKLVDMLGEALSEVERQPDHPLRVEFDRIIANWIERLQSDPDLREKIRHYQVQLASNDALTGYVDTLWKDISTWLNDDLRSNHSIVAKKLASVVAAIGATLQDDAGMQLVIDNQILLQVPPLLEGLRPKLAMFIASKMKEWKEHEVVQKLELNIGRDLQFIRLNGTLVGGCVGLGIHLLTMIGHR
ncbi:DUF445 family protein [Trinickia caryophylli]|uniref:Uncharacterized membrane-anchored protein YjiN, DUF445 family n=1 Tax=Trinickia caryophylli TaxID=28094 RepID=A0A1X7CZW8_TRICW|nr:DUF445 family protein [Trinickia caryophylli]WQE15187.1 DUF445 family protein [Trinickia caryophylli]GLU31073.1 hypothetical protein Busp01_09150 [Trinickia caryophylli]SMF06094.1 Uncharacterized membrane-anchored protein YjiN, DUF445 family [Trinickia caryophylli]